MNSNHLLDIITTDGGGAGANGMPSNSASSPSLHRNNINFTDDGGDGGMHDILSSHPPPPRPSLQDNSDITAKFFGLNLGRSQTAAPETWEYGKQLPSSTKSATALSSTNIESENGIFGSDHHHRRAFFDIEDDEDDRESFMRLGTRRPASTGVIGRPNNGDANQDTNSRDVNSILETLGITSLEPSPDKNLRIDTADFSGGMDVPESMVKGGHIPSTRSIMEHIQERNGDSTEEPSYFQSGEGEVSSRNLFSYQGSGSSQIGSPYGTANQQQQQQPQQYHRQLQQSGPSNQGGGYSGQHFHSNQYAPQEQSLPIHQARHQDSSPYNFQQQQVYYHHQEQASPQAHHPPEYRSQHPGNINLMQGTVLQMNAGQQQTVYHINSPTGAPFGFDYQSAQQQQLGSVPANHILSPHHQQISGNSTQMHGQPQYISIVPIQAVTAHSIGGGTPVHHSGQPTYAYVQYGDGTMAITSPSTLVAGGGGGGELQQQPLS